MYSTSSSLIKYFPHHEWYKSNTYTFILFLPFRRDCTIDSDHIRLLSMFPFCSPSMLSSRTPQNVWMRLSLILSRRPHMSYTHHRLIGMAINVRIPPFRGFEWSFKKDVVFYCIGSSLLRLMCPGIPVSRAIGHACFHLVLDLTGRFIGGDIVITNRHGAVWTMQLLPSSLILITYIIEVEVLSSSFQSNFYPSPFFYSQVFVLTALYYLRLCLFGKKHSVICFEDEGDTCLLRYTFRL